ncbi:GIY-YIG nuclease family protein [Gordonia sp. NPDC062954]|uniref:GIY-YIG nuclease family protein n=1 Tax=Gordonia sp. NPDC062954 TaxID=3364003 RepID=UPI0037C60D41
MAAAEPNTPIIADGISSELQLAVLIGVPSNMWIETTEAGLAVMFSDADETGVLYQHDGTAWRLEADDEPLSPGTSPDGTSELSAFPAFLSPRRFRQPDAVPTEPLPLDKVRADDYYDETVSVHRPVMQLVQTLTATGWRVRLGYVVPSPLGDPAGIQVRATAPPSERLHDKVVQRALGKVPGIVKVVADWSEHRDGTWAFDRIGFVAGDDIWPRSDVILADYAVAIAPPWTLADGVDAPLNNFRSAPTRPAISLTPPTLPSEPELVERRQRIDQWAIKNGYTDEVRPANPSAVKALLAEQGKGFAGYYLLEFRNGECYVGQSVSIDKRLGQHLLVHPDTVSVRVKTDPDASLATNTLRHLLREERALIHSAQTAGLHARNKSEMTVVTGSSSLDEIIPADEQAEWLSAPERGNRTDALEGRRFDLANPAVAGSDRNFRNLTELCGESAGLVPRVLGQYLNRCVVHPHATEGHYWNLSAPMKAYRGGSPARCRTICCLTVGMVETLVILRDLQTGDIDGFMQVNGTALFGDTDPDTAYVQFKRQHPGVEIRAADYHDSGPDNLNIDFPNLRVLTRLLEDQNVTRAAATATLLLMRVRRAPRTRQSTHCPELVTAAWNAD